MKTLKKQNGLTMWGWLVVLTMVGFIGMQFFALVGPAINYSKTNSVLDSVAKDASLMGATIKDVKASIIKKLSFNDVNNLDMKNKEVFKIQKSKNGILITVNYEQRAELFGPLDMVLTLNREVEVGK